MDKDTIIKFTRGYYAGVFLMVIVINGVNYLQLKDYYFEAGGLISQFSEKEILMIGLKTSMKALFFAMLLHGAVLAVMKMTKKRNKRRM